MPGVAAADRVERGRHAPRGGARAGHAAGLVRGGGRAGGVPGPRPKPMKRRTGSNGQFLVPLYKTPFNGAPII